MESLVLECHNALHVRLSFIEAYFPNYGINWSNIHAIRFILGFSCATSAFLEMFSIRYHVFWFLFLFLFFLVSFNISWFMFSIMASCLWRPCLSFVDCAFSSNFNSSFFGCHLLFLLNFNTYNFSWVLHQGYGLAKFQVLNLVEPKSFQVKLNHLKIFHPTYIRASYVFYTHNIHVQKIRTHEMTYLWKFRTNTWCW